MKFGFYPKGKGPLLKEHAGRNLGERARSRQDWREGSHEKFVITANVRNKKVKLGMRW